MRHPSDIIHNGEKLSDILEAHRFWLRGAGGQRANLRAATLHGATLHGATLRGATLTGADLTRADLTRADLYGATLTDATLTGADLRAANLTRANLTRADLRAANLTRANLTRATLTGANLSGAILTYANLTGAILLCTGNMCEIRTMQIDRWVIGYTADTLQIGCQRHAIEKWRQWNTDAGRKWIAGMDDEAVEWADRNLALVLAIIDANPATPTGHEV